MNKLRYFLSPKLFIASLALVVTAVVGYNALQTPASAGDCSTNSIVKCGFTTKEGFKSAYLLNVYGDIHAIYNHFNFQPADMERFMATAVGGTVHKDGRVVLDDGRIVGINAYTLGRESWGNPNRKPLQIGHRTYFWSYTQHSYGPNTNAIRALIMMDQSGKNMEFGVLTDCGNPFWATLPEFHCDMLNKEQKGRNTFEFWTDQTAKNGATVSKVVYNFGDGKTAESTNPAARVSHTYDKPGNYKATVTVHYNVHGRTETHTQAKCETPIEVKEELKPIFACTGLAANLVSGTRNRYTVTVKAKAEQGAILQEATFHFGDGTKQTKAATQGATEVTSDVHEYTQDKAYTITADLKFNVGEDKGNQLCKVNITIKPKTCVDTPNAPECQPKECKPGIPEGDARCQDVPQILPSTGPTEMLIGALGMGSLVGAGLYYHSSRRNLIDLLLKR